jgi:hypothetical protein
MGLSFVTICGTVAWLCLSNEPENDLQSRLCARVMACIGNRVRFSEINSRCHLCLTQNSGTILNMKHVFLSVALFGLSTLPGFAAEPMNGPQFESYVTGKTLYFGQNGEAYGVEEYLENRRVRWSFLDGKCKDGVWYEDHGMICFVYEDNPNPQCWSFFEEGSGLRAIFENDPNATTLYEAQQNDEPMLCLGPEIGV